MSCRRRFCGVSVLASQREILPAHDRRPVCAGFHFPEASVNELTIAALDPVALIPEFKVSAVKIERVT